MNTETILERWENRLLDRWQEAQECHCPTDCRDCYSDDGEEYVGCCGACQEYDDEPDWETYEEDRQERRAERW